MPSTPGPIRALTPLVALRAALLVIMMIGAVASTPRLVARLDDHVDPSAVRPLGVVLAVVFGAVGVGIAVVYVLVGRAVRRRQRAASVILLVGTAYLLVSVVSAPVLPRFGPDPSAAPFFDFPTVLRSAVVIAGVVVDLAVTVLLLVPRSRAWFAVRAPQPGVDVRYPR